MDEIAFDNQYWDQFILLFCKEGIPFGNVFSGLKFYINTLCCHIRDLSLFALFKQFALLVLILKESKEISEVHISL